MPNTLSTFIPSQTIFRRYYTEHECDDGRHWATTTFSLGFDWEVVLCEVVRQGPNVSKIVDFTTGHETYEFRWLSERSCRPAEARSAFQIAERIWARQSAERVARAAAERAAHNAAAVG